MATARKQSQSFLSEVADHETSLLAKLEASKAEAQEIVDNARADARKHLQQEDEKLTEEVAAIRRERQDQRQKAFDDTVAAAEAQLSGVRDEAFKRAPEVAKKVLALFLPKGASS